MYIIYSVQMTCFDLKKKANIGTGEVDRCAKQDQSLVFPITCRCPRRRMFVSCFACI